MSNHLWKVTAKRDSGNIAKGMSVEIIVKNATRKPSQSEVIEAINLKYGAKRSNPDGSISLLSHHVEFAHPVSKELISIDSPVPDDNLWKALSESV